MARKHYSKNATKSKDKGKPNDENRKDSRGNPMPKGDPSKVSEEEKEAEKEKASNDIEWYARDPQLLLDAARIPYSDPMGPVLRPIKFNTRGEPAVIGNYGIPQFGAAQAVPGIINVKTKPSYGYSTNRNHPLNTAAQMLYTHVRYVNSGRKNYDPADLMLYMVTMCEIYSYIFWLERTYNTAFMYSQRNYYFGAELITSQGININSVINNLANFRFMINTFINKVASFVIPGSIEMFKRRVFMYSSVYTESSGDNIKDQLYQFVPAGFYRFEYDTNSSGMMKFKQMSELVSNPNDMSVEDLMSIGSTLLENIFGDEDFGLMSGDILKAFGDDRLGISSIGDEGLLVPVYQEDVLLQIKNATIWDLSALREVSATFGTQPNARTYYTGDIIQDFNGNLISIEAVGLGTGSKSLQALQFAMDNILAAKEYPVDPAIIVESTRLTTVKRQEFISEDPVVGSWTWSDSQVFALESGSDIVVSIDIITHNQSGSLSNVSTSNVIKVGSASRDRFLRMLPFCKYLPIHWACDFSVSGDESHREITISYLELASDVWNYTIQSPAVIARLHQVALLSLLYVPGVSKITN